MAPFVVPLIIAGVQVAGALSAQAAANASTKNAPRIKTLEGTQAAGQLTREGEAEAMAGRGQELQGIEAANRSTEAALGQLGATSGRDLQVAAQEKQRAVGQAAQRFTDRWAQAFANEGQELEDRRAIRRDRTNKAVTTALTLGGQAAASAGNYAGNTEKGPKGGPDWKAIEKQVGKDQAAQLQTAYEKLGDKEFRTLAEEVWGAEMADTYMTAYGLE